MSFKMLDDLSIIGRRGDSASFTFEFEDEIADYNFVFQIKKNITDKDDVAIIKKTFTNPQDNTITVELSKNDTLLLASIGNGYTNYCWGLKAYLGDNYAQTIIPRDNAPAPKFAILPAMIEMGVENAD